MFHIAAVLFLGWIAIITSAEESLAPLLRYYDHVHFTEFGSWSEFQRLFLDEGSYFLRNVMLGVANTECRDKLYAPALLGLQRHASPDVVEYAMLSAEEYPVKLTDCAEVHWYRIGDKLGKSETFSDFNHDELNSWIVGAMRTPDVVLTNGFSFPIEVFWHEESKSPVYQRTLQPNEDFIVTSFIGHIFSANSLDPVDERELSEATRASPDYLQSGNLGIIDFMVVDGRPYTFSPANRLETCDFAEGYTPLVSASVSCDDIFLRFLEFAHYHWHHKRIGLNFVQPKIIRPVTETGFELRPLPESTFQWLREWYMTEQMKQSETESAAGPCMNQVVAPTAMTHITPVLKDRLSDELRPILEGWFNGPLQLTSIYGIRKYINGSVLRMHVDTANTHVVSAIINVDQAVERDWPLLILDHEGNEHNVTMKPGDMVLYESARLLHGRPDVFLGEHYDNIFIHYKPVSDWNYDWL